MATTQNRPPPVKLSACLASLVLWLRQSLGSFSDRCGSGWANWTQDPLHKVGLASKVSGCFSVEVKHRSTLCDDLSRHALVNSRGYFPFVLFAYHVCLVVAINYWLSSQLRWATPKIRALRIESCSPTQRFAKLPPVWFESSVDSWSLLRIQISKMSSRTRLGAWLTS